MTRAMRENLAFRVDDLASRDKRTAWVALLRDIFGLDFTAFSALDIWPAGYRAFSYLDGTMIAANISCNPLPLRLAGRDVPAAQLQGVATRPAYRRQGLFHDLMAEALRFADTRYECLLLYTATPALYEPFGFRLLPQHGFRGRLALPALATADIPVRSLSIDRSADIALMRRLFAERQPISERLGLMDNEAVFFGNLLLQPQLRLSYLPADDILIVWDKEGLDESVHKGRGRLIDLVGAGWPRMEVLAHVLALPDPATEIDVLFPPDRLDGVFTAVPFQHHDDLLMVRGPFAIGNEPFMLPLTALS